MPSNSFESQPVPNNAEQEPTEYYARNIFKLQREIDEAEAEKKILLDMFVHFEAEQDITPEAQAGFTERFAALRRFQTPGSVEPVNYVERLAREARAGDQQFGPQIDVLTGYQIEWHEQMEQFKAEQAEENAQK